MKRAAIALLFLIASAISTAQTETDQTKIIFDKFKNLTHLTTLETTARNVTYDGGKDASNLVRRMGMIVHFNCPGRAQSCKPAIVELLFVGYTSDWIMNGNNRAIFLIDGKAASGGHVDWDGHVIEADSLLEDNDLNISLPLLKRLAGAKSVDVQIGEFEFSLSDENLAAIKDIASHAE